MASSLNAEVIGVIPNENSQVDSTELALVIQQFIAGPSKLKSPDVLTLKWYKTADGLTPDTVMEAIRAGACFFDAIMILSKPANQRPVILDHDVNRGEPLARITSTKKWLWWSYLNLMVRARWPMDDNGQVEGLAPNFMVSLTGFQADPTTKGLYLYSGSLSDLTLDWIKKITTRAFAREVLSRFGLGTAGYRLLAPCRIFRPREDAPEAVKRSWEVARRIASHPQDWSIHPLTRDPNVLSTLGPINANALNLLLEGLTEEDFNLIMNPQSKILYLPMVVKPGATNWKTWDVNTLPNLTDPILDDTPPNQRIPLCTTPISIPQIPGIVPRWLPPAVLATRIQRITQPRALV
jgi:hypothetical protein